MYLWFRWTFKEAPPYEAVLVFQMNLLYLFQTNSFVACCKLSLQNLQKIPTKSNSMNLVYWEAPGGIWATNSCWLLTPKASSDIYNSEIAAWIIFVHFSLSDFYFYINLNTRKVHIFCSNPLWTWTALLQWDVLINTLKANIVDYR